LPVSSTVTWVPTPIGSSLADTEIVPSGGTSGIALLMRFYNALNSRRSYKNAWSNDEAFAMLRRMAGSQIAQQSVDALIARRAEVEQIQIRFKEDPYG